MFMLLLQYEADFQDIAIILALAFFLSSISYPQNLRCVQDFFFYIIMYLIFN